MKLAPCRDCGAVIDLDSRGCPICARNLDAERAVAKYTRLTVVLIAAALIFAAAYLTLGRG